MNTQFDTRLKQLIEDYQQLLSKRNIQCKIGNGIYDRYESPILTSAHVPLEWRYDLNEQSNPFLMERFGINAVFNAGAIKFQDKYVLVARVEGADRKSFFAVAESDNGIDNFKFWEYPIVIPETSEPDTNVYDMRLVAHEDGWIYGLFCTERRESECKRSGSICCSSTMRNSEDQRPEKMGSIARFENTVDAAKKRSASS